MCDRRTRRSASARPPAGQSYLNQAAHPVRRQGQRRAGDPSRLRLPVRERRVRGARSKQAGLVFVGPSAACIRTMGDKVAAKRAMREAGVPCVPGPDETLAGRPGRDPRDRRRDRLPRHHQGGRRRRRARHARRGQTRTLLLETLALTKEEARHAFGNPEVYIEKFLVASPPRRDPGHRRPPRHGAVAGQPRLLAAAPQPEGDRGGAGAGDRARAHRPRRRALRRSVPADRLLRRRHLRVPVRGRPVLLHRDEHAHPGRASRDRDDDRHRHRPASVARRARREAVARAGRGPLHGPRVRVPDQCRGPEQFHAVAGPHRRMERAGRVRRARR